MEKVKILGPLMIPNLKILRFHKKIGEYNLVVSQKVTAAYRERFHKNGKDKFFNLNHETPIDGIEIIESFLIDKSIIPI